MKILNLIQNWNMTDMLKIKLKVNNKIKKKLVVSKQEISKMKVNNLCLKSLIIVILIIIYPRKKKYSIKSKINNFKMTNIINNRNKYSKLVSELWFCYYTTDKNFLKDSSIKLANLLKGNIIKNLILLSDTLSFRYEIHHFDGSC